MKDPPHVFLMISYFYFTESSFHLKWLFPQIFHTRILQKSLFIPSTPKGKLQFAPFFMSNKRSLHIVGLSSVRFCICDNKT